MSSWILCIKRCTGTVRIFHSGQCCRVLTWIFHSIRRVIWHWKSTQRWGQSLTHTHKVVFFSGLKSQRVRYVTFEGKVNTTSVKRKAVSSIHNFKHGIKAVNLSQVYPHVGKALRSLKKKQDFNLTKDKINIDHPSIIHLSIHPSIHSSVHPSSAGYICLSWQRYSHSSLLQCPQVCVCVCVINWERCQMWMIYEYVNETVELLKDSRHTHIHTHTHTQYSALSETPI